MRQLFEIDLRDYEDSDCVFSRPSARGIIFRDDNKIALVYSKNESNCSAGLRIYCADREKE